MKRARIDWCTTSFAISDAAPTPAQGSAQRTPEGYLIVDAYLARDGLLKYSDGRSSWLEYRPAAELAAAAQSFEHAIVTDDHPPKMLDAANARVYQRGAVLGAPTVETIDGVTYLRGRVRVTDAELVRKIEAGQREISIGFWSDVQIERGTIDGQTYEAIQTGMAGNHVASVTRGRSGPAVRVLLDSAGSAVHNQIVRTYNVTASELVTLRARANRMDEVGMPTTEAKLVGPDGTEIIVPTWVAAAIEELREMKAQGTPETPAGEPADAPATEPAADELPLPEDEKLEEEEMKDKAPPFSKDAAMALVRKRVRLERLAAKADLDVDKLADSDDEIVARAFVCAVNPAHKSRADKATGDTLALLVDLAAEDLASRPAPTANPWEQRAPINDAANDPLIDAQVKFLRSQGVEI